MLRWLTERRRRHLLDTPFPEAWRDTLAARVAAYARLDDAQRARLRDLVQVFVAEKTWEGCGGLELAEEHQVTIAGQACRMLLARDHDLFGEVESILVYPTAMQPPPPRPGHWQPVAPLVQRGPVRGESHHRGPVLLAWDAVIAAGVGSDVEGGAVHARNLVVHELAHKIDDLDGRTDGTPPLPDGRTRRAWVAAFEPAFLAHRDRVARGEPSFLRDYATQNEAEFFAVASEAYFEQPRDLAAALPDVHAALRAFYGYEPLQ
jgi:Mlc titration factor MtfA (ptsG expression regulator)